jgi:hypothetical protein
MQILQEKKNYCSERGVLEKKKISRPGKEKKG